MNIGSWIPGIDQNTKCKFFFCPNTFLVELTIVRWEVIFKMVKKKLICGGNNLIGGNQQ